MEQPTGIFYLVAWLIALPMFAVAMWSLMRYVYIIVGYFSMMDDIPRSIPFVGGIAGGVALYMIPIPGMVAYLSYPIWTDIGLWLFCGLLNIFYFQGKNRVRSKRYREREAQAAVAAEAAAREAAAREGDIETAQAPAAPDVTVPETPADDAVSGDDADNRDSA